jgi:hypothetical protein
MVAEDYDELCAIMSSGRGNPHHKNQKINNVHRKDNIEQLGEKKVPELERSPTVSKWVIMRGGNQEVSQKVVWDENPCHKCWYWCT